MNKSGFSGIAWLIILLVACANAGAQSPQVPSRCEFAGMRLNIRDAARREIQADVDALRRNDTYFRRRLESVDLYFPIIERIFREENIPDDFKYLVIQESALVPDAVSSSQAVGFWQFKEATAREVGMKVDRHIDERMHIITSTRGASVYLKQLNFFYNNWIYALMAYNTGRGGAERYIDRNNYGAKSMEINNNTHWYVKKYLAHKFAFENEGGRNPSPPQTLVEYADGAGRSLEELASRFSLDPVVIANYNKWLRRGKVPENHPIAVILPMSTAAALALNAPPTPGGKEKKVAEPEKPKAMFTSFGVSTSRYEFSESDRYPIARSTRDGASATINSIPGKIARPGDDAAGLADAGGLALHQFMKYNDLTAADGIQTSQAYYFGRKMNKAQLHYHIAQPGETMWAISQKFGVRLKKLMQKNRMTTERELEPGRVLWLRYIRPAHMAVEYRSDRLQKPATMASIREESNPVVTIPPAGTHHINPGSEESEYLFDEDTRSEVGSRSHIGRGSYVNPANPSSENSTTLKPGSPTPTSVNTTPETSPANEVQKNGEFYHTVVAGETLYSISRLYNLPVEQIAFWNKLPTNSKLNTGQRLIVGRESGFNPDIERNTSTTQETVYKVKPGDTLYSIARQYGMTVKDIMELNKKDDFTLQVGEEIKVKKAD